MNKDVWKWIATSLLGIIIGSSSTYFGETKLSKHDISEMIALEAPLAIKDELKEIKNSMHSIELDVTRQTVEIKQILEAVKK